MPRELGIGARLVWEGARAEIVALSATSVQIRTEAGDLVSIDLGEFRRRASIAAEPGSVRGDSAGISTLNTLSAKVRGTAEFLREHVVEVMTGRPYSDPDASPRPEYDPEVTTSSVRRHNKADELRSMGVTRSAETLRRDIRGYQNNGILGLIDGRHHRQQNLPDERKARVVVSVLDDYRNRSSVSDAVLITQMMETFAVRYPGVPVQSSRTWRRLLGRYKEPASLAQSAKTRRSRENAPQRSYGRAVVTRPGEQVQVDGTPLDIRVLGEDGKPRKATLLTMVDVATLTIIAGIIRPESAEGFDHALLLGMALFPLQFRRPVPMLDDYLEAQGLEAPDFTKQEMPYIVPESLTRDNGKDYRSNVTEAAMLRYGISVNNASPHTPTDKPIVERTFRSINDLFSSFVSGYKGGNVLLRGKDPDADALPLPVVNMLWEIWVRDIWQHRAHSSLRDPSCPGRTVSPNERYRALIKVAPVVPMQITEHEFLELLPVVERKVTHDGVRIHNRTYRSTRLTYLANLPGARQRKWPVSHYSSDPSRIWVKSDTEWIVAVDAAAHMGSEPFSGDTWLIGRDEASAAITDDQARARMFKLAAAAKRAEKKESAQRESRAQDQELLAYPRPQQDDDLKSPPQEANDHVNIEEPLPYTNESGW